MENGTILVVEDDANDEFLMLRALKKNNIGNKVFVVRDGAEALDYLFCRNGYADREPTALPELVLLDIKLPKVSGLEVLHHIRADSRTQQLCVILLSSSNEPHDLSEGYRLGANSFVRKPVDFVEFVEFVGQLASYWLGLNKAHDG